MLKMRTALLGKILSTCAVTLSVSVAGSDAFAGTLSGFVTPAMIGVSITGMSLSPVGSGQPSTIGGFSATNPWNIYFYRIGGNFSPLSSSSPFVVPTGRYAGVTITYLTQRTANLFGQVQSTGLYRGNIFQGTTTTDSTSGNVFTDNSTNVSAIAGSTLTSTTEVLGVTSSYLGSALTNLALGYSVGQGTSNTSTTNFANPVCVTTSGTQGCSAGDTVVVTTSGSSTTAFYIVLDMYHALGVDATNSSLDQQPPVYPYAMLGAPAAAIHLTATNGTGTYGDISLIFDSTKRVIWATSFGNGSLPGFCQGVGFVNVTAVPTGGFLNSSGTASAVNAVNTTTGQVQFATGNCSGASCASSGVLQIANALGTAAGGTTAVTCVADGSATPAFLGYTYASGVAGAGTVGTTNFTVTRIIDPSNIFGKCPAGAATQLAAGTCASTNVTTGTLDGYP